MHSTKVKSFWQDIHYFTQQLSQTANEIRAGLLKSSRLPNVISDITTNKWLKICVGFMSNILWRSIINNNSMNLKTLSLSSVFITLWIQLQLHIPLKETDMKLCSLACLKQLIDCAWQSLQVVVFCVHNLVSFLAARQFLIEVCMVFLL